MRWFNMRRLLPLALVCLVAAQVVSAGRALHRERPKAVVPTTRKQYVQFAVSIEKTTCAQLPKAPTTSGRPGLDFNLAFRAAMRADLTSYINALVPISGGNASAIIATIGSPGTNCTDWSYNGVNYAGVRAAVSFNGTDNTNIRDFLWGAAREGICTGGYSQTAWVTVAQLIKATGLTVRLNNGSRQNPFGANMGWVPIPQLPCPPPKPVASPSPAPVASPSPAPVNESSPSPAPVNQSSPSPAPVNQSSPSPAPVNQSSPSPNPCPAGAAPDASGACVCGAGLAPALNGTTLIACVNRTGLTSCPAIAPIEVKNLQDPTPVIVSCITESTPCPSDFPLILYNGVPSTRQECRPNTGGCNIAGFSVVVTKADTTLVGCVNGSTSVCPSPYVAFRSAANSFAVDKCVAVTSCPDFNVVSTIYTVPALNPGSTQPVSCMTLGDPTQTCPDLPAIGLSYPLEVVAAIPNTPACGSTANPCTSTRVIQCLTSNDTCPSSQSLRLFRNTTGTSGPVVVECRQTRGACDFTAVGMTTSTPNAGTYNIELRTGDALDGCLLAGSTTCPPAYPFPTPQSGIPTVCRPNAVAITCTGSQIPRYNVNGSIVSCQDPSLPCPNDFPITLRSGAAGTRSGCLAYGSTCPTAFSFPLYSYFTAIPGLYNQLTITNCWANNVISTCSAVIIGASEQPAGIAGTYSRPIVTNTTATERLAGCVVNTAPGCPAAFPFSFIDWATGSSATTLPTVATVDKCAPAGEVTSCPALPSPPPATGVLPTVYYKPGYTKSTLTACIKFYTEPYATTSTPRSPVCPPSYPIVSITQSDPMAVTGQSQVVGCWSADSSCAANSPQPFTIVTSANTVAYCVPQIIGITSCAGYPVTAYQSGVQLFSPDGSTLTGCTATANTCPPSFPIYFQSGATIQRCQASIVPGGTCASVSGNNYPNSITGSNGTIVGCAAANSTCSNQQLILANTPEGPAVSCSNTLSACPPSGTYTFPLYDATQFPGTGRTLVRCIPPPSPATTCDSLFPFNVKVFGTADGSGNVVGCMKTTTSPQTLCPSTSPIPYLSQVANADGSIRFVIDQCRTQAVCTGSFSGVLATATAVATGCLASSATTCPGAYYASDKNASVTPYNYPFILSGATAGTVDQCRELGSGTWPLVSGGCAAVVGASSLYTVPLQQLGVGNSANLAGCSRVPALSCPAGYIATYSSTNGAPTISSCSTTSTCSGSSPSFIYDAAGTQIGCGDSSACTAIFGASNFIPLKNASDAGDLGCISKQATVCPGTIGSGATASGFPFSIWTVSGKTPVLNRCLQNSGLGSCPSTSVSVYDRIGTGQTLIGCTGDGAVYCPVTAQYFRSATDGTLTANQPTTIYCFKEVATICPVNNGTSNATGSIAVRTSNVGGDISQILGCVNAPAGRADLGPGGLCPVNVPTQGSFTFYVAAGQSSDGSAAAASGAVTAGNIVGCHRFDDGRRCISTLAQVGAAPGSPPAGCVALSPPNTCPAGLPGSPTFELWGPVSTTSGKPQVEACIATPGSCPAPYTVPISDGLLNATGATGTLEGCAKALTACPPNRVPLISGSLQVSACRAASGCPSNFVPVCTSTTMSVTPGPATATCAAAADTLACLPSGSTWPQCALLAGNSTASNPASYPVNSDTTSNAAATQFKFVVDFTVGSSAYKLLGCSVISSSQNNCQVSSGWDTEAYPVGNNGTNPTNGFIGCTSGNSTDCQNWWRVQPNPGPGGAAAVCT